MNTDSVALLKEVSYDWISLWLLEKPMNVLSQSNLRLSTNM